MDVWDSVRQSAPYARPTLIGIAQYSHQSFETLSLASEHNLLPIVSYELAPRATNGFFGWGGGSYTKRFSQTEYFDWQNSMYRMHFTKR